MIVKAILVDDESNARRRLRTILNEVDKEISIIDEAADGYEAIKKISQQSPDVVFLDIDMPGIDGLELLKYIQPQPHIIFVTAHEKYAIEAFNHNAVHYILKPVSKKVLSNALSRVRQIKKTEVDLEVMNVLSMASTNKPISRIPVRQEREIKLLNLEEIGYFEASDKYSYAITNKNKHFVDNSLSILENRLPKGQFLRTHRRFLVNTEHVCGIEKISNGNMTLSMSKGIEGRPLVSKSKSKLIKDIFLLT